MNRRRFISTCAAAGCAASGVSPALAAAAPAGEPGPFASVPLRMAPPYGWFEGEPDDRFAQIRAWGFGAYEWLGPDGDIPALRAAMDRHGLALTCIVGAG
jgi:hypothetical protein